MVVALSKEQAKENLKILLEKFKREFESGKTDSYNEEATKIAFIQPLLKDVLGWDVNDNYEVSPEEKVSRDRVDYGLKVDGKFCMLVEAKPVKADLEKHVEQAVKYGYNKRDVPFVMLTDFEGIKVFDTTVKPNFKNLNKGLKIDLDWKEYVSSFDELWLLSKESAVNHKLDELIKVKAKDRQTIDRAILDDLEGWREILAKDIYKNNHGLFNSGDLEKDGHYLKEITQKILDRVIFMRFCEDRNLSNRPSMRTLFEDRTDSIGTRAMALLDDEFKQYNVVFNSDLFGRRDWDGKVLVHIKALREIILGTYDPYLFDVIPLEVLGNIYEQYLGYTIRLTEQQVKYELKPEVRKAGGVYYTPKYIVDYIVKNTVGKILEEGSPAKIKNLSILDPACGSGSFLIRAYEEMLNYYKNLKAKEAKGDKIMAGQGELETRIGATASELNITEKAEILKRHIYGVDIDDQAVEVTKLSLMLKMLEGEHGLVGGRGVLPMLDRNIKCGNSLISGDSQELFKYFGKDYYKVKPFDWKTEFKQVMVDEGGFDVVIGNPPYEVTLGKEKKKDISNLLQINKYFKEQYKTIEGETNLYKVFTEKGINLVSKKGMFSFIMPTSILNDKSALELRKLLLEAFKCVKINEFPEKAKVFENVIQGVCVYVFSNNASGIFMRTNILDEDIGKRKVLSIDKRLIVRLNYKIPLFKSEEEIRIIETLCELKKFKDIEGSVVFREGEIHLTKFKEAIRSEARGKNIFRLIRGDVVQRYNILNNSNKDSFIDEEKAVSITNAKKMDDANQKRLVYQQVVNMQKDRRLNFAIIDSKMYVGNTCGYVLVNDSKYDLRIPPIKWTLG